jgi:hypothetical protein
MFLSTSPRSAAASPKPAADDDPFGPNPSELNTSDDDRFEEEEEEEDDDDDDTAPSPARRRRIRRHRRRPRKPKTDDQVAILGTFDTRFHWQVYRDLRRLGLLTQKSVTPATDFLLVPDKHCDDWKSWKKMKDARRYGTQIIDERDLKLLGWHDFPLE